MAHTYLAFIDESGDDGLTGSYRQVGRSGGSSRWLVISALLYRKTHSLDVVKWRDEILEIMPDKKSRDLHFAKMNHGQKLAAVQSLSKKPVRTVSIICSKQDCPAGVYHEKNQLYFYITRYLIERLSWLCRDYRPQAPEGNGQVAITFSRRGGMQYGSFRDYLRRLKQMEGSDVRIHWPVIDIDGVKAADHSVSASLQFADTVASSFAAGFEPDLYGNCEPRYSKTLKPVTYARNNNYLSYGVKLIPSEGQCQLNAQQLNMVEIWR